MFLIPRENSKVFNIMVKLKDETASNRLIIKYRFGYTPGQHTIRALYYIILYNYQKFDNNEKVIAIYLDQRLLILLITLHVSKKNVARLWYKK